MSTVKNNIIATFLSLILLVAIAASAVGFSFDIKNQSQNCQQAEPDLADNKSTDQEDNKGLKEKFAHSHLGTVLAPSLAIDLTHLNTDLFTQKFFLSVPVSPPNS